MQHILSTTQLKNFTHRLFNGEQVVRNKHLAALIGTQFKGLSSVQQQLLAQPRFSMQGGKEIVTWVSNLFTSTPVPLSELQGEERERYIEILYSTIKAYQDALPSVNEKTRELITQALTFHSLDTVYGADGVVAITEWGMTPAGTHEPVGTIGTDYTDGSFKWPSAPDIPDTPKEPEQPLVPNDEPEMPVVPDDEPDVPLIPDDEPELPLIPDDEPLPIDDEPETPPPYNGGNQVAQNQTPPPHRGGPDQPGTPPPVQPPVDSNKPKKPWWSNWWKWLLAILILILLLLGLKTCMGGGPGGDIPPIVPPIDTTKIVVDDSLRYVVEGRVVLMVRKGELEDFIRDFQHDYDTTKYKLYNAKTDGIIQRVTLLLPEEERKSIVDELQQKYPQYEIMVMPETVYQHRTTTNDPGLKDANKNWYFEMCGVFEAWDVTMGSDSVVVAIIDADIDITHPELKGDITEPFNAYEHTANIPAPLPDGGHGTHVSGTAIGAAGNAEGIAGIAPKCKFMPISVNDKHGQMSTSTILDAVEYAILQGADVVNMSLGMRFGNWVQFIPAEIQQDIIDNTFKEEEAMWNYIFEEADRRNVTFVLAGGNENILIGLDPMERSPHAIKVSAVKPDKSKADFSNYGPMSTLSAPGVQIFNAWPHGQYQFLEGTSMAAPIVTGGVALLKSKFPGITTKEIVQILRETGIPSTSDVGPIVHFGRALKWDPNNPAVGDDCDEIARRYEELLRELEKIRREHPECIQDIENPDTMLIPENPEQKDFTGLWKSTTSIHNTKTKEELVLYFQFNGDGTGSFMIVEPDGTKFTAPLRITISGDFVEIDQIADAEGPNYAYNPYWTKMRPDKDRKAQCHSICKTDKSNQVDFSLVRIR